MDRLTALSCKLAFNSAVRMRTWKKMSVQMKNGISPDESLSLLRDQAAARKSPLAALYARILSVKKSGHELGTALTGFASPEEILLISSGQSAGRLPESLLMATELLEAKKKIRAAVMGVVTYPLFLLSLCIVILLIIAVQVIPELAALSDPRKWTGMSAALYAVSNFVVSWKGIVSLLAFIALIIGVGVTLPVWTGPIRRNVDGLPPWSMYRLVTGSVWLFTVSTLMRSGLQLSHIMGDMLESSQLTPYLRERVRAIFAQTSAGKNLGDAMFECGMDFPDPEVVDELRTYAALPGFQERLFDISSQWMQGGIEAIQQKSQIFSVLCLLFIVALVCVLGISIMDMQAQMMNYGG